MTNFLYKRYYLVSCVLYLYMYQCLLQIENSKQRQQNCCMRCNQSIVQSITRTNVGAVLDAWQIRSNVGPDQLLRVNKRMGVSCLSVWLLKYHQNLISGTKSKIYLYGVESSPNLVHRCLTYFVHFRTRTRRGIIKWVGSKRSNRRSRLKKWITAPIIE